MIEVEKKFKLDKINEKRLIKDAEFLGEKKFTDIYYDTQDFSLTKNDIWLRKRGEEFELKLPVSKNGNHIIQSYTEIEGEDNIRQVFDIIKNASFLEDIQTFGYKSFCTATTVRKKYKKEKFNIDLDKVDYGDFQYCLAEIEIMVTNKDDVNLAADRIMQFAKSVGLRNDYVRGKIIEYLYQKKPQHFSALVKAGVVREEKC